ncbi:MAG: hypothetical protein ACI8VW_001079 [bacterium]|jgi:hypothetical protein
MHLHKHPKTSVHELRHTFSIFVFLAILGMLMAPKIAVSGEISIAPNETYTPQQVITIVVDSLQKNTAGDEGIATVFRFASPGNKSATGPLSRFTQMLKSGFSDMLNHTGVRYDAIDVAGDMAVQAVWLQTQSGAEYGYAFQLRKQRGGTHDGMWMTDAVIPLGKNRGIRI